MGAADLTPHPAQRRFVEDEHRFVLAVAGAQGGKTIAAARLFAWRVENWTRARGHCNAWVVTPIYELATMPQRYLRERWPHALWSQRMAGGIYAQCVPFRGALVKFRSAEHPDKLVSEPVDVMWLNETARMKAEAWRGNLKMRLSATGGCAVFDTTPVGQNWVYEDLFLPSLPPGDPQHDPARYSAEYSSHRWHTADNPAVSRERVEEARRTLPAAYFAREFLADFSAFHGQVYPHFGDHCIARQTPEDWPELAVGIDWGYAPGHLGVLLVCGIDRTKRRIAVLAEVCAEGHTDDWWCGELVTLCRRFGRLRTAVYDPSAPDKADYFRAFFDRRRKTVPLDRDEAPVRGLVFREADNAVRDGIMCVADLLCGRLQIDPSCKVTIRQLRSYHWLSGTERSGGDWQERPAKVDDDACDALRYVAFTLLRREAQRPFR